MALYRIENLTVKQLDRIVLPKFQRGFVWTETKKNDFVQTLHDGYPFGTLLVYPLDENNDKSKLQLLDGQQRLSTIRQYKQDPLHFWKPLNRDEYMRSLRLANSLLDGDSKLAENEFDALINMDAGQPLTLWIINHGEYMSDRDAFTRCVFDLKNKIAEYVDLDALTVPMVVYTGAEEHLAEVFANLNRGGVPLTKYEVFSASWVNATITLASADESLLQDRILQYVKQYYMDMQKKAEFELQDFSEDELSKSRTITLAEFGTALGQYAVDHLTALVPQTSTAVQEIGFGLLGVATNLDNRKLKELNSASTMQKIIDGLEAILQKTERICNNLQSLFSTLLRRFKDAGNNYENGLSATFKTLSYFAALWNLEPSSEEYKQSLRNIKAAYVYDSITQAWSSHGDSRLLEYQSGSRDYLTTVSPEQFRQAFDQWIDDQTPGIVFRKDVRCLVTIHANLSYLSASVPDGETFELEHIIARKRINAMDGTGEGRRVLGSSLGNCMYLPHTTNNAKKDKTLYEVNNYGQYSQLIEESQYFSEADMERIGIALESSDFETVNKFIRERSQQVAYFLVDSLLKDSVIG